ncbi:hypothetical protein [Massilia sp. MS-15]|uniref:hypothetical protein n=1 Tax=Massilia sp. MS-15 TaxID=2878200 RepID=UPI001CD68602|nr:hypothetical protein [Massilia sp. MS-15]MCA1246700.1 hypothetical protein [Massilia sp. MS-15]
MNAALNARLRDYRMLWRAAVTHADPRMSGVIRWGAIIFVIVLAAAQTVNAGPREGLATLWTAASVLLLLNWAWRFMPGAMKLNTPVNAWLVPQMRQRLVELSCLVCLAGIAGFASAPHADTSALGLWLLWMVIFVVGIGLGAAGHRAAEPIITTLCFTWFLVEWLPKELGALLSHPVAVVLALPIHAGVIVVAVRAMFPQGGERHWEMVAKRLRWVASSGQPDPLVEQMASKQTRGWYGRTLRRDSARRDGRRLALHALGPTHHLGESVAVLAILAVVVTCTGLFSTWRADREVTAGIGWLFACTLLAVPVLYSVRLARLQPDLAAEQGLVRLAPAMPGEAAAFNVQLGRGLLLQALAGWALATGAALLLAALGAAKPEALLRVLCVACIILPVVAAPLRNHASRIGSAAGMAATLLLVSMVAGIVLGLALNALSGIPALPVAALASIGLTVVVVVRGLRTMRHAPCAFPAGRID